MKQVSLSALATTLGVSKTLVSLVLNGKGNQYGINKGVQEKVKEKAIELNYRPNQTARSLRSGKTYTLGLMLGDLNDNYQSNICKNIETIAASKGYNVLISSLGDSTKDKLTSIISKSVDGVIVSSDLEDESFNKLIKNGFPVVMVDHKLGGQAANFVGLDYTEIIYQNSIHLLKKGRTKIAIAFDQKNTNQFMSSVILGAEKALLEFGLTKESLIILSIDAKDRSEVSNVLKEVKANNPELKALISTNDMLTLKLVEALNEMDIHIPQDFSVISLYDHEMFPFIFPKVSANKTPYKKIAEYTLELLIKQMNGDEKSEAKTVELLSELVERSSC